MINYSEGLTVVWLTMCLATALLRLRRGDRRVLIIVFVVFYCLFALPLVCDLFAGLPEYSQEPGFYYASRDPGARAIYLLFVSIVPLIWLLCLGKRSEYRLSRKIRLPRSRPLRFCLMAMLALPVLLMIYSPNPELYLTYGFVVRQDVSEAASSFHPIMNGATFFAVMSAVGLIAVARRVWFTLLASFPFLVAAVWLNGKRAVFGVAVVMIFAALWYRGKIKSLGLALAAPALLLASFSILYQGLIRQMSPGTTTSADLYENVRVDYGRDSRVKMAAYSLLHPSEMTILDFPGQTVLFDIGAWIPRSVWPDKPFPYAVYFTSAMLGQPAQDMGWGMTTSLFDEVISNVGWPGLLLGPLIIGLVCWAGESTRDPLVVLLTILVACLLMSVELVAFAPLFVLWGALVIKRKVRWSPQCG